MNIKFAALCLVLAGLLAPVAGYAADADFDQGRPMAFVKDSAITASIKTQLAAEKVSTLLDIKVDTDSNGAVVLSGTAKTHEDVDKVFFIASRTKGVTSVKSNVTVANK